MRLPLESREHARMVREGAPDNTPLPTGVDTDRSVQLRRDLFNHLQEHTSPAAVVWSGPVRKGNEPGAGVQCFHDCFHLGYYTGSCSPCWDALRARHDGNFLTLALPYVQRLERSGGYVSRPVGCCET